MASEDDRLKAVIAREKARKAREAEEAAKAEIREREKAELRRSAQQRWASLLPQLRAVVATLNEQIKEADLELELREDSTKPDAAVAWLSITLNRGPVPTTATSFQPYLALRLSGYGKVQPSINLPGAPARDLPSSELRELDAASFRSILIGFLDDAIPNSR